MSDSQDAVSYKSYWMAWLALLVITVAMVFVGSKPVLILGMLVKATIIAFLFMHLKYERLSLVLTVLLGIFATGLILFGLIIPDGMAM